jgi:hypothetical protein
MEQGAKPAMSEPRNAAFPQDHPKHRTTILDKQRFYQDANGHVLHEVRIQTRQDRCHLRAPREDGASARTGRALQVFNVEQRVSENAGTRI